mgnify:CR=1 FL=1
MPSPFPGMDPFLEDPIVFPDFHGRKILKKFMDDPKAKTYKPYKF